MNYVDEAGTPLIVEATTSWSFVGAGLRLSMELLGPEYSMSVSTLDGGTKVFFSRRLQEQEAGEDLIEKQNAEQGLMPIVGNEAASTATKTRTAPSRDAFLDGVQPELNFHAGRDVTELLMACYMSAEEERVIEWKPSNLLATCRRRPGDEAGGAMFWRRQRLGLCRGLQRRRPVTIGVQSYSFRDRTAAMRLPACRRWA